MQLTIASAALLRAVSHAQSVVERRSPAPILGNICLEASADTLSFHGTNMDLWLIEHATAQVSTPGRITVPVHLLHDIMRKIDSLQEVHLSIHRSETTATEVLRLRAGRARFDLATLPASDFPSVDVGPDQASAIHFSVQADILRRLIDQTRFAISVDQARYYLNGIYFHRPDEGPQTLCAVATDGHRLARAEADLQDSDITGILGAIIPRKTIEELRRLIDGEEGMVAMHLSQHQIRFEFGAVRLISKLIDSSFPDYQRVIPADNNLVAQLDSQTFAKAIDRVSTLASERMSGVKMLFSTDQLRITAADPAIGQAEEEFEITYSGEELEIGFNARMLLELVRQIKGETICANMKDSESPILFEDSGDKDVLYILMPMRV